MHDSRLSHAAFFFFSFFLGGVGGIPAPKQSDAAARRTPAGLPALYPAVRGPPSPRPRRPEPHGRADRARRSPMGPAPGGLRRAADVRGPEGRGKLPLFPPFFGAKPKKRGTCVLVLIELAPFCELFCGRQPWGEPAGLVGSRALLATSGKKRRLITPAP